MSVPTQKCPPLLLADEYARRDFCTDDGLKAWSASLYLSPPRACHCTLSDSKYLGTWVRHMEVMQFRDETVPLLFS